MQGNLNYSCNTIQMYSVLYLQVCPFMQIRKNKIHMYLTFQLKLFSLLLCGSLYVGLCAVYEHHTGPHRTNPDHTGPTLEHIGPHRTKLNHTGSHRTMHIGGKNRRRNCGCTTFQYYKGYSSYYIHTCIVHRGKKGE